jgi:hypothetical protein
MYFGGAKMRIELTLNGQNAIALIDRPPSCSTC